MSKITRIINVSFLPSKKQSFNILPPEILNLITLKHVTRRKWQVTRDPAIKISLNLLTHTVQQKLQEHRYTNFNNNLSQVQPNSSSLWSAIRSTTKEKYQITIVRDSTKTAVSGSEKAELFAQQFYKSFTNNRINNYSFHLNEFTSGASNAHAFSHCFYTVLNATPILHKPAKVFSTRKLFPFRDPEFDPQR